MYLECLLPKPNKGFNDKNASVPFRGIVNRAVARVESCARGQVLDELMDGDIIVFERADNRHEELELPTCQDYFKYIFYKVEVQFVDKTVPNDPGSVVFFLT